METLEAKGVHDHPEFKLGAVVGPETWDNKTVKLSDFLNLDTQVPVSWDFDKGRKPFPSHLWGNNNYGDCEIAGRCNSLLRLQRLQTNTTPGLVDQDAIDKYKLLTGCKEPGDRHDTGMSTLDNLRDWHKGWPLTKNWQIGGEQTRNYHISAYGYIDPQDGKLVRLSSYVFTGLLYGVDLPRNAQNQTRNKVWEVENWGSPDAEPGSWGGHCVYSKRFDADNIYFETWGMEVRATNDWVAKYAVEAYAVIDSLDTWFKFPDTFDAAAMIAKMKEAGINVEQ